MSSSRIRRCGSYAGESGGHRRHGRGMLKKLDKLIPVRSIWARSTWATASSPRITTVVGEALLATLSDAFGGGYTTEVHEAWTTVYDIVKTTMIGKNYDYMDATYAV